MSQEERENDKNKKSVSEQKREFGCPCGKMYLSYPALFTHVKQKHNGKPPGQLIKPKKNENVKRGRPPIHPTEKQSSDQLIRIDLDDYFNSVISESTTVKCDQEFISDQGVQNCNQIFSKFLKQFANNQSKKQTLSCMLLLLRTHLKKEKGEKFCQEENASQIIEITNDLVNNLETYSDKYPISRQLLINLLWGFFAWLYKEELTDHRLQRII